MANVTTRGALRTAATFGVLDQAVSSLTNILVVVMAARISSREDFASFAIVYTVFSVLMGASAAYVGHVIVLDRRGEPHVAAAARAAVVVVAASALGVGGVTAVVLSSADGSTARALAMLGLVLPIVLTQDILRYCFSALRLAHAALIGDILRLVAVVAVLGVQPEGSSAGTLVLGWGLSAFPAVLFGVVFLLRRPVDGRLDVAPLLRGNSLGRRFVTEYAVGNAASQVSVVTLGVVADKLAVGALRGATTLLGPLNVLFNATTAFGPPQLARLPSARRVVRATSFVAVVLGAVAVTWTGVLLLLPEAVGREILGDTWESAHQILVPVGAQYLAMAAGTSAIVTLRVLEPTATLRIQVTFSVVSVGALFAGYALGGVSGAAWGLALGSALKAVAMWARVRRALRQAPFGRPDGSDQSDAQRKDSKSAHGLQE